MKKKTLTAAPVLAEPTPKVATRGGGEARESNTVEASRGAWVEPATSDSRGGSQSNHAKDLSGSSERPDAAGSVMVDTREAGATDPSPPSKCGSTPTAQKPSEATAADWKEACERAQRATDYAAMFSIRPLDARYQDPVWQWENRVQHFDGRKKCQ